MRTWFPGRAKRWSIPFAVLLTLLAAGTAAAGQIENPRVISGPSMLREPALNAIRQWHYRPFSIDNEAVDVITTIDVKFALSR